MLWSRSDSDEPIAATFVGKNGGAISAPLVDGQDKPEKKDSSGDEEQIHQPFMPHPPAGQGEFCADQDMQQEEEDQVQVQFCVHMPGLI